MKGGVKGGTTFPLGKDQKETYGFLYSSVTNNLHILTASMFSVIGLNKL